MYKIFYDFLNYLESIVLINDVEKYLQKIAIGVEFDMEKLKVIAAADCQIVDERRGMPVSAVLLSGVQGIFRSRGLSAWARRT